MSSWSRRPPPWATTPPRPPRGGDARSSPIPRPAPPVPGSRGSRSGSPSDGVEDRERRKVGFGGRGAGGDLHGGAMLSRYAASVREQIDRRAMTLLSTGHAAVDFSGGALPASAPVPEDRVRPLVHARRGAGARLGALVARSSSRCSGSGPTPAGRSGSCRRASRSPAIGMAAAADAPAYWLVVVLVIVSGLGTAAYHPEGSKFAAYTAAESGRAGCRCSRSGAMSATGSARSSARRSFVALGLQRRLVADRPRPAVAAAPARGTRYLLGFVPEAGTRSRARAWGGRPAASLGILLAVITFRSLAWYGLLTFVPLWEVSHGHSKSYGTASRGRCSSSAGSARSPPGRSPTGSGCAPC